MFSPGKHTMLLGLDHPERSTAVLHNDGVYSVSFLLTAVSVMASSNSRVIRSFNSLFCFLNISLLVLRNLNCLVIIDLRELNPWSCQLVYWKIVSQHILDQWQMGRPQNHACPNLLALQQTLLHKGPSSLQNIQLKPCFILCLLKKTMHLKTVLRIKFLKQFRFLLISLSSSLKKTFLTTSHNKDTSSKVLPHFLGLVIRTRNKEHQAFKEPL